MRLPSNITEWINVTDNRNTEFYYVNDKTLIHLTQIMADTRWILFAISGVDTCVGKHPVLSNALIILHQSVVMPLSIQKHLVFREQMLVQKELVTSVLLNQQAAECMSIYHTEAKG